MLILILVIIFILTIFAFFNLDIRKKAWFIGPFIFIYVLWAISNFAFLRIVDYELSLFIAKSTFAIFPILCWGILLLVLYIPIFLQYRNLIQVVTLFLGIVGVLQTYMVLFTHQIVTELVYSQQLEAYTIIFEFSNLYYYAAYLVVTLGFAIYILYLKYGLSKGYMAPYLEYLFWACVLGITGVMLTNFILPIFFGIYQYLELGAFFALSVVFTLIYGLTLDSFSSYKETFQDILSWCIRIFYLFIGITIFFILAIRLIYEEFPPLLEEVVFLILLVSILVAYATRHIDNKGILLEKEKSNLFRYLEDKIALELRVEKLCFLVSKYIKSGLGVADVSILVFDQKNRDFLYKVEGGDFKKKRVLDTEQLLDLMNFWQTLRVENVLLKEDLRVLRPKSKGKTKDEIDKKLEFMDKNGIEILLPLNRRVVLNGMIVLGGKSNGLPFGRQDYELLEKIVRIASMAFGRAILYQEVEEFSGALQQKVREQTSTLNKKLAKMEDMRRRERDLISIMGHELRTPLTIAKNSVEMIESYKDERRKKRKPVKWNGYFEKYFSYLKTALHRESAIVETLLVATKIDAGRIEANLSEVDLKDVVENARIAFEQDAEKKGLKFKVDMDQRKNWRVIADVFRIQQVVDNLVSNAVKYTEKGEVRISVVDLDDEIGIYVSDTGEGLSKKDLRSLGKKFYRAKQYIGADGKREDGMVRPGGTGLGLYVAFGLIKLMKGRYTVESQEGKGSVFRVYFPKA